MFLVSIELNYRLFTFDKTRQWNLMKTKSTQQLFFAEKAIDPLGKTIQWRRSRELRIGARREKGY